MLKPDLKIQAQTCTAYDPRRNHGKDVKQKNSREEQHLNFADMLRAQVEAFNERR